MSSILTNQGAMVALQTMKSINKNMSQVQSQISTGLKIGSAKDNAATWAISKVMESDVKSFGAIRESLALGSSTVNVARNAAEAITGLLGEIKEKIVLATEDNVDRGKIQEDIVRLREQVVSVVAAAQFNGLNMVDGSSGDSVSILASLNRSAGGISPSSISVDSRNLTLTGTALDAGEIDGKDLQVIGGGASETLLSGLKFVGADNGSGGAIALPRVGINNGSAPIDTGGLMAGDKVVMNFNGFQVAYQVGQGDDEDAVTGGLAEQLNAVAAREGWAIEFTADLGALAVQNNTEFGGVNLDFVVSDFSVQFVRDRGELAFLNDLNVAATGDLGRNLRADALQQMEQLLAASIDAAAAFGSAQRRIEIQQDFVGSLMDSMRAGIGAMVDADMEEASARLQALQVQQQLGIQALSIANQQPQNILSLFR